MTVYDIIHLWLTAGYFTASFALPYLWGSSSVESIEADKAVPIVFTATFLWPLVLMGAFCWWLSKRGL